jgi:hypothetical protein
MADRRYPEGSDSASRWQGASIARRAGHWVPDAIVATVIKGDRVFVGKVNLKAALGEIFVCEAIWTKAQEKHPEALEQVERDYRACTNARAHKERSFAGVTKEAQNLVDRLAGD